MQYRAIFCAGSAPTPPDAHAAAERILRGPPLPAEQPSTQPVSVRLPAGAGEWVAVASADGGACLVQLPAGATAGSEWSPELPAARWGDPLAELRPAQLVHGDRLSCAVLGAWAKASADDLLAAVGACLARVEDGAYVATIAEHASHACAHLGRVGLDMSALLRPMLRNAALRVFGSCLRAAASHWAHALLTVHWAAPPASAAAIAALSVGAPPADGGSSSPPMPPMSLLRFVPVAVLCNHAMAAFNHLRPSAAYELRDSAAQDLASTLAQCAATLRGRGAEAADAGGAEHHSMMVASFRDELTPFLAACLDVLLPQWTPPDALGTRQTRQVQDDGWAAVLGRGVADALAGPQEATSEALGGGTAGGAELAGNGHARLAGEDCEQPPDAVGHTN